MKRQNLTAALASLALVCSSVLSGTQTYANAIDVDSSQSAKQAIAQVDPAIADGDWYSTIQENIRRSEYNVTWQDQTYLEDLPSAYQAPNRAQNLRTYFTTQGVRVIPRVFEGEAPPWEWGLSLSGYGYAGDIKPVTEATFINEADRVEYQRDTISEWYVNDERGLEQGFTLHTPPQNTTQNPQSEIALDLALSGNLTPQLTNDGMVLEFTTPGGVGVLRYSDLVVFDATGHALPAHIELTSPSKGEVSEIRVVIDAAGAVYPITVDPILTMFSSNDTWIVESDLANSNFGWSVGSAGDVNDDGYSDVIIGAPYYDNGETNEGQAYVYHGSPIGLATSAAWITEGNQAGALFGQAVGTAGDVNGDGYADVIIGAPSYNNGEAAEGRAFVYHGGPTSLETSPAWTTESNQTYADFGTSVGTAGDVNFDGYSDVIVGAPDYDNGETNEGRAYVYHGSSIGLNTSSNWTAEINMAGARFGYSVGTAGDVNGDGYSDIIIGAPGCENGNLAEGCAFIIHGSAAGLVDSVAWVVEGNRDMAYFGDSVRTAGDVNGDGYSDVIVVSYLYELFLATRAYAYVYHGSASGVSTSPIWTTESNIDGASSGISVATAGDVDGDGYSDVILGSPLCDDCVSSGGKVSVYHGSPTGLISTATWTVESDQNNANFGTSVSTAGDVNGDGYSDVIIGADLYDNGQSNEGRAYVYYGAAAGVGTSADWIAEGDQAGALFGRSVSTAGDVNGDGFSDVIIGAPDYDNGQTGEGLSFVYYGSATGLNTSPDWTAESNQMDANFGISVSNAGDVNGDGFGDVIVGAYLFDNDETNEGRVYVYHGSATGLSPTPAWTAESNQVGAQLGYSVSTAGDVNGDGYSDVIIGVLYYTNGQTNEGRAYVYHGSSTGLETSPAWFAESNQNGANFGMSVDTAGDVNGDGYSDVIIGAYMFDNGQTNEGRAFVYHGSSTGLDTSEAWTAEGDQDSAVFGISVSTAGDVNGDGYSDVIVGAQFYANGQTSEGRAYVYHGAPTGLSTSADWIAESDLPYACFGNAVSTAGDVNGDGYSDVLIGAYGASGMTNTGKVYAYLGSSAGLAPAPDWTVDGSQAEAWFGYSVSTAGDVNGDGYSDVIIGAPFQDNDQTDEGRAYVYYGAAAGVGTSADWIAEGDQAGALFGRSVSTAGDVNGDGFSDVIIGAPDYDNGQTGEGLSFVYYGSATGLNTSPDWTAESNQMDANFGISVSNAGDVNGDGFGDVIVGAYLFDNDETNEGRVYVYHGSATGLSPTPAWTAESNRTAAQLGYSVSTAGDVNGDGYSDVIIGAFNYSNDQVSEGRAYVYHGSSTGLETSPAWFAESNQNGANFGMSVDTAGDVNGDGYSDVIIGAYMFDNGQTNEGRAYVYHGSSTGLDTSEAWTAEGDQDSAVFGISVSTAGDVNGDGYSDVIVGAQFYANGQTSEGRAYVYHGAPTGLSTSADWIAESDLPYACFGNAVSTAGDVNGDGYSDVLIGAYGASGMTNTGKVYAYLGSSAGLAPAPDWTVDGSQAEAWFGYSVSTAGDVNGDGYSDVIIGAPFQDNDQTDEGRAYVYYGNQGDGIHMLPQQMRSDSSASIALLGLSDSPTTFRLSLIGRSPLGRTPVKLQWQAAPLGTEFDDAGALNGISADWTDVLTTGVTITEAITDLEPDTSYHWRIRLLYQPGNALGQPAGRWLTIPVNGWNEADLRTHANEPPVADAGSDQTVFKITLVTLDGSLSSDPDGHLPLTYLWTQTGGEAVSLSDPTAVNPTFTSPANAGALTFILMVTDNLGLSAVITDEVVITVFFYTNFLPMIKK